MTAIELDAFTRSYVETALWSSLDESNEQGGEPLDANYTIDDIAPETLNEMCAHCAEFQRLYGALFLGREARAGHDFWLTRNGHGAGFWDGDWQQVYQPKRLRHERMSAYLWRKGAKEFPGAAYPHSRSLGSFLTYVSKPYGSYDLYIGDDGLIHGS
jgi:hypothetical protein